MSYWKLMLKAVINILMGSTKLLNLCKTVICECSLDDNFPGGILFHKFIIF